MFTSVTTRAASAYKRVAVETGVQGADPHQLVGMLYDALLQSMNQARGAIERGEVEVKGAALGKAVRILEEGLKAGLNLRNDSAAVAQVVELIEPLAQSWQQIRAAAIATPTPATGRGG
jgi:flagellar protein FliS